MVFYIVFSVFCYNQHLHENTMYIWFMVDPDSSSMIFSKFGGKCQEYSGIFPKNLRLCAGFSPSSTLITALHQLTVERLLIPGWTPKQLWIPFESQHDHSMIDSSTIGPIRIHNLLRYTQNIFDAL